MARHRKANINESILVARMNARTAASIDSSTAREGKKQMIRMTIMSNHDAPYIEMHFSVQGVGAIDQSMAHARARHTAGSV